MLREMGLRDIDPRLECESVEEAAALGLLALMKGISQDYRCANWLVDLEYDLWRTIEEPSAQLEISDRERILLRLLSEECNGWWVWDNERGEPKLLPLEEWRERVRNRPPSD